MGNEVVVVVEEVEFIHKPTRHEVSTTCCRIAQRIDVRSRQLHREPASSVLIIAEGNTGRERRGTESHHLFFAEDVNDVCFFDVHAQNHFAVLHITLSTSRASIWHGKVDEESLT